MNNSYDSHNENSNSWLTILRIYFSIADDNENNNSIVDNNK